MGATTLEQYSEATVKGVVMSIIATELTALLVADPTATGAIATPTTTVDGDLVSAAIEIQSTTRALLLPRMTTAQRDAIEVPFNGMLIYNIDVGQQKVNTYSNGGWTDNGGGDVVGPGSSADTSLAVFNGVTGKVIKATNVLLNPISSIVSGIVGLFSGAGTAAAPTYTFSGDTDTGLYSVGANETGIATAGVLQMSVSGTSASVNHLRINGSATGSALTMTAVGTDTDISVVITPKGAGQLFTTPGTSVNPAYTFTGGGGGGSGMFYSTGTAQTSYVGFSNANTGFAGLNGNGVLSLGSTTFDATATKTLAIGVGTAPTGVANVLQIYAATIAGNVATLGLNIPAGSVTASTATASTAIQVRINNTTYYLLANTVP